MNANPTTPATTIAATCAHAPHVPGASSVTAIAPMASAAVNRDVTRFPAIPHRATATTATAAAFNPAIAPSRSPKYATPIAASARTIAEGVVKPMNAANMPGSPARRQPSAMPTCDDAGPGRNWHRATTSAYSESVSHLRLPTNSSRK